MYSVWCSMSVWCISYSAYIIQGVLESVYCTVYMVNSIVNIVHRVVCAAYCIICSVQYIVEYSVQCIVHNGRSALNSYCAECIVCYIVWCIVRSVHGVVYTAW